MRTSSLQALLLSALVAAGCNASDQTPGETPEAESPAATPAAPAAPAAASGTPEAKIASATSAAPPEISGQAMVMDMDAAGTMTELRPGTNGWMCVPDGSATPGVDPMCADKGGQEWLTAYFGKKAPPATAMGIAYMLAGGSDASNTDPYAQQPAAGDEWIASGPHIMVLPPDPALLAAFSTDPKSGGPYVMWKGTPYAHLMVPVESPK